MARIGKKRYINTRFWEDIYISNLDPIEKLLFLYFITNPHTNICGVYELPLKTVATDTGIEKEMVEKVLLRFSKDKKIYYISGWVCVINFSKHQGDSPSIKLGIENALSDVPHEIILILQQKDTQSPHSVHTVPPQPDLSISKSKSKSKSIATYDVASEEVVFILNSFKEVNPSYRKYFNNTTQRAAVSRLLKEHGKDKLISIIAFLPKSNASRYAPTITTPVQLEEKLGKLIAWSQRLKDTSNIAFT